MSLEKLIKNKEKNKTHFIWNNIEVFIKDRITNKEVSFDSVLDTIEQKVPRHLLKNVDAIYVGNFDFLNNRDVQASYENSAIFVTNDQNSTQDMADDIVHEIAHSVEETYQRYIYADGKLEKEFTLKRKQLYDVLKAEDIEVSLQAFLQTEFSKEFDEYLHLHVGYPLLDMVGSSIFYSPYAATSLREYFANGFEALFYFGDYEFVSKACPVLFEKLNGLMEVKDDQ